MCIVLKATTEHLDVVLEEAANAQEGHAFVSYEDINKCNGQSAYGSQDSVTTGATEASICDAPAADHWRLIKHISYFNDDDEAKTVTLRIDNGTTEPTVFQATLATKESLYCTPEGGWKCMTAAGLLKVQAHAS